MQDKSVKTREVILKAVRELIQDTGTRALRKKDIASRANICRGKLQYQYPAGVDVVECAFKEDLVLKEAVRDMSQYNYSQLAVYKAVCEYLMEKDDER